ncbi:hypothetical protein LTR84_011436 [Exophiala bonariae]|uniref:Uncharacterized protein n=1 Tax=Exophiala bonariae TaxID=1690606 RepID=A0AAV9MS34_9EURO|nr:hypothetical protein LTR84_011436 [Exophiala bonariae]
MVAYGSEISPLVAGTGLVDWGDTESTVPAEARCIEFLETGKIVHAELQKAKKKVGKSLCAYAAHCRESKNELVDVVKALKSLDQELSSLRQTFEANQEQLILYQGLLDTAARLGHGQTVIDVNESEVQRSKLQKEIGKQDQRLHQVELQHRESLERKLELETHSSSRRSAAVKCLLRMERANKAMAELRRCDAKRKRGSFSEGKRDGEGWTAGVSQQPSRPTNLCHENWRVKTENGETRRSRRIRKY